MVVWHSFQQIKLKNLHFKKFNQKFYRKYMWHDYPSDIVAFDEHYMQCVCTIECHQIYNEMWVVEWKMVNAIESHSRDDAKTETKIYKGIQTCSENDIATVSSLECKFIITSSILFFGKYIYTEGNFKGIYQAAKIRWAAGTNVPLTRIFHWLYCEKLMCCCPSDPMKVCVTW